MKQPVNPTCARAQQAPSSKITFTTFTTFTQVAALVNVVNVVNEKTHHPARRARTHAAADVHSSAGADEGELL